MPIILTEIQQELYQAYCDDDVEMIRKIVENSTIDLNFLDYFFDTPLGYACAEDNLELTKLMLENGADPNYFPPCSLAGIGLPPLMICSEWPVYDLMLSYGARINTIYGGRTALSFSSGDTMKLLLEKGADPDILCSPPLQHLISTGGLGWGTGEEDIILLLEYGANPNVCLYDGDPALMVAINNGAIDVAKALIRSGASIDVVDMEGWTPLTKALCLASKRQLLYDEEDLEEIKELLQQELPLSSIKGASFDTTQDNRLYKGFTELCYLLIEGGADINKPNHIGCTPLIMACVDKDLTDIAMLLLDRGADPNSKDIVNRQFPIYLACDQQNEGLLKQLISCGADINASDDRYGYTALITAATDLSLNMMQALLVAGADVNSVTSSGKSALSNMLSVQGGMIDMFHELNESLPENAREDNVTTINYGNQNRNKIEGTILELLVKAVQLLLDSGADPMIRDKNGQNAYDIMNSSPLFDRVLNLIPPPRPR